MDNLDSDVLNAVLYAIGLGVETLRDECDASRNDRDDIAVRMHATNEKVAALQAELASVRSEHAVCRQAEPNRLWNLAELDRITLALYYMIRDASQFAVTAKVKAERKAWRQVMERLIEIRGLNTAEREGLGLEDDEG